MSLTRRRYRSRENVGVATGALLGGVAELMLGHASICGELLVTLVEEMRAEHKAELARIDKRFDGFEKRFDRIDERFDAVDQRITGLEVKIAEVKSDLMKWSFVFWCGAVAAIAALAGVLRS